MATISKSTNASGISNFPETLVTEMYNKVQGRSTIAKLSAQTPIPFNGIKEFVFSMDGKAQIVGEGGKKMPGEADYTPIVIRPVKFVYQHRISNEYMYASDEAKIGYLKAFSEGFAMKIAEGIDIAAFHGLNPYDMAAASFKDTNSFDGVVTDNVVVYDAAKVDDVIDSAVQSIVATGGAVNGIALSPTAGSDLAKIKVNGVVQYPEYRFGQNPDSFYGMTSDVNNTVSMKGESDTATDHVILGDFQNAFKWGYTKNIPLEVIQYGDPDQTGRDLKAYNEVCLRAEAYVGWGILAPERFAMIQASA